MASACELMCQPSASSAIELNHQPATISTTIVTTVIHVTAQAPCSAVAFPASNTRLWVQGEGKGVSLCIGVAPRYPNRDELARPQ